MLKIKKKKKTIEERRNSKLEFGASTATQIWFLKTTSRRMVRKRLDSLHIHVQTMHIQYTNDLLKKKINSKFQFRGGGRFKTDPIYIVCLDYVTRSSIFYCIHRLWGIVVGYPWETFYNSFQVFGWKNIIFNAWNLTVDGWRCARDGLKRHTRHGGDDS
jgi:hypothetical protein